ncbi:MAG: alkaline phosphatase D family protein [Dehalococcoidia bacterium]
MASSHTAHVPFSRALLTTLLAGTLLLGGVRAQHLAGRQSVVFSHGVACGDATSDSVVLWTRTDGPATVTPELLDTADGALLRTLPSIQAGPETDFTVKVDAMGLTAGEKILYGDADWKWRPYPILNSLNQEPLDFFVFLGDLIYETTNFEVTTVAESLADYCAKYRENRELPPEVAPGSTVPLQGLYGSFSQYSVFDNHETGPSKLDAKAPPYNDGGAPAGDAVHQFVNQTSGWKDRIQAYAEYNPVRQRTVAGAGDPRMDGTDRFYSGQSWGSAMRLFTVDDRSYRDARLASSDDAQADAPGRTMLGTPQLQWLEDGLLAAQRESVTWKFVVISSPIQQIGRASEIGSDLDGSKSWAGGYRVERDRLLKFIDDNAIDNVVFLTTDNHYTMINNLRYRSTPEDPQSALVPARNAFEILTGPIGAGTGLPPVKANVARLTAERDVDRVETAALVGDQPNTDGMLQGQKQAGLDPVGLESNFPGLIASSLVSDGGTPGVVEPQAFTAYLAYMYAVLTVDNNLLTVQVEGIPAIDLQTLGSPDGMNTYLSETPRTILSFQVQALME